MNWNSILAVGLIYLSSAHVSASAVSQDKHRASDLPPFGRLGYSVSISGDLAIAGALGVDPGFDRTGAAYLYQRVGENAWIETDKLAANPVPGADPLLGDQFGFSIALSGNTAVIGANSSNASGDDSGLAYVFDVTGGTGTQMARLTPNDAGADQLFGTSVAAGPRSALIGARGAGPFGASAGAAYLFEPNSSGIWNQAAKLTPADGAAHDGFGISVALSGDRAIVGAYGDDSPLQNAGSAYIFEVDAMGQWTHVDKLTANDADLGDALGISVAIDGDMALVGAWHDDERGLNAGAAYLFRETSPGSWDQLAKFTASDASPDDRFGAAVAIQGANAIISAPSDGMDQGAIYVFRRNSSGMWAEVAKRTAFDAARQDVFGFSVALNQGNLVVGAPQEHFGAGAVYFLQVPEPSSGTLFATIPLCIRRKRCRVDD